MYHGIVKDNCPIKSWTLVKESLFLKQMKYLKMNFNVLSIQNILSNGLENLSSKKPLAVITFDDGYHNNYKYAFPILKRFYLPATIFLTTNIIGRNDLFWFDKIINLLQQSRLGYLDLRYHRLSKYNLSYRNDKKRWEVIQNILTDLKKLSSSKRDEIIKDIEVKYDIKYINNEYLLPLNEYEIDEMSASGLIEFGSHTHGHEILTQLKYHDVEKTIINSFNVINKFNYKYNIMSYPNGDYDKITIEILKKYNVCLAFTTNNDFWVPKYSQYEVPRIAIGGFDTYIYFKLQLNGILNVINRLLTAKNKKTYVNISM